MKKISIVVLLVLIQAFMFGCTAARTPQPTPEPTLTQTVQPTATATVPSGPARLQFIGHDCFLLTAGDGTRILMDPYRTAYVPIDISTFPPNLTADLVTMSQLHPDHSGIREVAGNPRGMYQAGVNHIGAVTITGYTTDQAYFDGSPAGGSGMTIAVTVFVLETGGVKIVHMGAAGVIAQDDILAAIENADVAIIDAMGTDSHPVPEMMAQLRKSHVRTVIPAHNSFHENDRFYGALTVEEFVKMLTPDEMVTRASGSEITVTPGMPVQVLVLTPSALAAQ